MVHLVATSVCEFDIKQRIIFSVKHDKNFKITKDSLRKEPRGPIYKGYQFTEDGLLMYKIRLYVPDLVELRKLIMDEFHKRPYVGHPGY
jgi:hypothetical protein